MCAAMFLPPPHVTVAGGGGGARTAVGPMCAPASRPPTLPSWRSLAAISDRNSSSVSKRLKISSSSASSCTPTGAAPPTTQPPPQARHTTIPCVPPSLVHQACRHGRPLTKQEAACPPADRSLQGVWCLDGLPGAVRRSDRGALSALPLGQQLRAHLLCDLARPALQAVVRPIHGHEAHDDCYAEAGVPAGPPCGASEGCAAAQAGQTLRASPPAAAEAPPPQHPASTPGAGIAG